MGSYVILIFGFLNLERNGIWGPGELRVGEALGNTRGVVVSSGLAVILLLRPFMFGKKIFDDKKVIEDEFLFDDKLRFTVH